MKKKFLFAVIVTVTCLTLTACGNPLKLLPEADGENIYNADEKTTGNEAADTIISKLKKDGAIDKKISEFSVEDREDKESKEKSLIEVCVVYENKDASFEKHFDVTMKYKEDDKEWDVKEYYEDTKALVVKPKKGVDEETLKHDISHYAYSPKLGDKSVYLEEDSIEIKIEKDKIDYDKKQSRATDEVKVNVTIDDGICIYETSLDALYYYDDYYAGEYKWNHDTFEWSQDYTVEYSDTFKEYFTPDNMIKNIERSDIYLMNNYYSLTVDLFDEYTFDEPEVDGGMVKVPGTAHFKNNYLMDVSIDFVMEFVAYTEPYEFAGFYGSPTIRADYSNMARDVESTVYDKYDNTKELGHLHMIFDKADDSEITGTLMYTPNGGTTQEITFTGAEYASWGEQVPGMVSLTLDEEVTWEKYSHTDTIYLSYDPLTGELVSDKTYGVYFSLG